jgi:hypothetical protein
MHDNAAIALKVELFLSETHLSFPGNNVKYVVILERALVVPVPSRIAYFFPATSADAKTYAFEMTVNLIHGILPF